MMRPGNLCKW